MSPGGCPNVFAYTTDISIGALNKEKKKEKEKKKDNPYKLNKAMASIAIGLSPINETNRRSHFI